MVELNEKNRELLSSKNNEEIKKWYEETGAFYAWQVRAYSEHMQVELLEREEQEVADVFMAVCDLPESVISSVFANKITDNIFIIEYFYPLNDGRCGRAFIPFLKNKSTQILKDFGFNTFEKALFVATCLEHGLNKSTIEFMVNMLEKKEDN